MANARSVLAVATAFGMNDLCTYAYDVCRQSITADTIQEWVEWIDSQEPKSDQISAPSSRASTPQSLPADGRYINGPASTPPAAGGDGMSFGTAPTLVASGSIQVSGNTQMSHGTTGQAGSSNGWRGVSSQPADSFVAQLKQDMWVAHNACR